MSGLGLFGNIRFSLHGEPDALLPTDTLKQSLRTRMPCGRRVHRCLLLAFGLLVLSLAFRNARRIYRSLPIETDSPTQHRRPPLYEQYHITEKQLPQHDPHLPFPEGRTGKYIAMENFVVMAGWGNAMQEMLLDAHVAYTSGRSSVFHPYTWNNDGSNYTLYRDHLIPSKIPLTAILTGPVAGAIFPGPSEPGPRAVVKSYFDEVCPHPTMITTHHVTDAVPNDISADKLVDAWVDKLNSIEDNCVMIDSQSSDHLISFWIFGDASRILPIWPSLSASPVITHFRWSSLIHRAFTANAHLFTPIPYPTLVPVPSLTYFPTNYIPPLLMDSYDPSIPSKEIYTMIPGLLVLHIRRGDFDDHCATLSNWGSNYNGLNRFPEFIDTFAVPGGANGSEASPSVREHYLAHCLPSLPQILAKVHDVWNSSEGEGLKYVYVMTNGGAEWAEEVKGALSGMRGPRGESWEKVATRRDLALDWEQKFVSQAVDMAIGQRSQVLIGNGFSSMTSNIVTLRMANGLPARSNRFW